MDKFTTLTGVAAPLDMINVDTDMIIPKQFLKTIQRSGLGVHAFSEMRYNTDGSVELETKSGPWTHAIQLGDIPTIAFGGVLYYEFLFDSNEVGGANSSILLDDIQLFVGDAPDLTGYDATADTLAGLSAVYRLDDGDDLDRDPGRRLRVHDDRPDRPLRRGDRGRDLRGVALRPR